MATWKEALEYSGSDGTGDTEEKKSSNSLAGFRPKSLYDDDTPSAAKEELSTEVVAEQTAQQEPPTPNQFSPTGDIPEDLLVRKGTEQPTLVRERRLLEDTAHKSKIFLESAARGVGQLLDLPLQVEAARDRSARSLANFLYADSEEDALPIHGDLFDLPPAKTIDNRGLPSVVTDEAGNPVTSMGFEDALTPETYGFKSEELRGTGDIFTTVLGESVGPSGLFGLVHKAMKAPAYLRGFGAFPMTPDAAKKLKVAGDRSSLMFAAADAKFAAGTAVVGTTVAEALFNDPEDTMEQRLATANLLAAASGLAPIATSIPTPVVMLNWTKNKGMKAIENASYVDKGSDHYKEVSKVVHRFVGSLIPEHRLPEIQGKMETIRMIQTPTDQGGLGLSDFRPTVGNIIGTEESRKIQRVVDTKNYEKAETQYFNTELSAKKLVTMLTKERDPHRKELIQDALRMYADDASDMAITMKARIESMKVSMREIGDDVSASEAGANIRTAISEMEKKYKSQVNEMYDSIDVDNAVKFDPKDVRTKIHEILNTSDPLKAIREGDEGFDFINKTLPRVLTELSERGGKQTDILGVGVQQDEQFFTTKDMMGLYKLLGRQANTISAKESGSIVPGLLNELRDTVLDTIENNAKNQSTEVYDKFVGARDFARDEYFPRFKEGVVGEVLRTDRYGNQKIIDDTVGSKFWQPGVKDYNINQLRDVFEVNNPALAERLGKDSVKMETLAKESLRDYAMDDLRRFLQQDFNGDMLKRVERWETKYQTAIKNFPEIKTRLMEVKDAARKGGDDLARLNAGLDDVKKISREYTDADQESILNKLYTATPEQAKKILEDIHTASTQTKRVHVESLGRNLPVPPGDTYGDIDSAVRSSFMKKVLDKATGHDDLPDWKNLKKYLKSNRGTLEEVLDAEDINNLKRTAEALELLGKENIPTKPAELNALKAMYQKIGVSPASMLSRYYSYALGKVGHLYLTTDALSRVMQAAGGKYFDTAYSEVMYDLEGLEKVLHAMGNEVQAKHALNVRQYLAKSSKRLLGATSRGAVNAILDKGFDRNTMRVVEQYPI